MKHQGAEVPEDDHDYTEFKKWMDTPEDELLKAMQVPTAK